MKKLWPLIIGIIAKLALLLLFACILTLVIFFLFNNELFENFKNILVFISEFLVGSFIYVYIRKQIAKGIVKHGSLSESLRLFLVHEPLVHSAIWILVLVNFVLLTYYLPIHSVQVIVTGNSEITTDRVEVKLEPQNVIISEYDFENDKIRFISRKFLRWGEKCLIEVKATGFEDYETELQWSGYAFSSVVMGNFEIVNLKSTIVNLEVDVDPDYGMIKVRTENIDSIFTGISNLDLHENTVVELSLSANQYKDISKRFLLKNDTAIKIQLELKEGILVISAFNEGGNLQSGMRIFINGNLTDHVLGQDIKLKPGEYRVYLEKERTETIVFVPEFNVTIRPDQKTERSVTTDIRRKECS